MIVKNAEEDIRLCLSSVQGLVTQIVVADTGSTDNTVAIATEMGATVITIPWTDDFAEARNAALRSMTTDWVLVLDSDEELAPESHIVLPKLMMRSDGIGGYNGMIRNYLPDRCVISLGLTHDNNDLVERAKEAPTYIDSDMLRFFRRDPNIFFVGRVHEKVNRQILKVGMSIGTATFKILHFGNLKGDNRRVQKLNYYSSLCRIKVKDFPDDAQSWYDLGNCEEILGNLDEALKCMEKAFHLSGWDLPLFVIAKIHARMGNHLASLKALNSMKGQGELGLMKHLSRGDILHNLNQLDEARRAYQMAGRIAKATRGLETWSHNIDSKLGYTEVRLGRCRQGLKKLKHAVSSAPELLESHDLLVKAYVLTNNDRGAADAAEALLQHYFGEGIYARAAGLRFRLGEVDRGIDLAKAGLQRFPCSELLQRMLN